MCAEEFSLSQAADLAGKPETDVWDFRVTTDPTTGKRERKSQDEFHTIDWRFPYYPDKSTFRVEYDAQIGTEHFVDVFKVDDSGGLVKKVILRAHARSGRDPGERGSVVGRAYIDFAKFEIP